MEFQEKKNFSKYQEGFTLVEALVAISVLLLAVAGPLTLVTQALQTSRYSSAQVTAFHLAEDALEYVRNLRDSNGLKRVNTPSTVWSNGLNACLGSNVCTVDTVNGTLTTCPQGGCPPIKYDSSTGRYQYSSGSNSIYTRSINIVNIPSNVDNEFSVAVTISWTINGYSRTFTARDSLLNWQ